MPTKKRQRARVLSFSEGSGLMVMLHVLKLAFNLFAFFSRLWFKGWTILQRTRESLNIRLAEEKMMLNRVFRTVRFV